jgi:hypothetical protein
MAAGKSAGIERTKGSGPYDDARNGTSWQLLKVPRPRSPGYYGPGLAGTRARSPPAA